MKKYSKISAQLLIKDSLRNFSDEIFDAINKEFFNENKHEEPLLAGIRQARKTTHLKLSARLDKSQPSILKIENKADMYISTLREVIDSLGGDLEITINFPHKKPIKILQFADLEEAT